MREGREQEHEVIAREAGLDTGGVEGGSAFPAGRGQAFDVLAIEGGWVTGTV